MTLAIAKQLNSFEIRCHGRVLKIKWTDIASNKVVISRMGVTGAFLVKEMFKRKVEFAGLVQSIKQLTRDTFLEKETK